MVRVEPLARALTERAGHQHRLRAAAENQMVDELGEARVAASDAAPGREVKRCRGRREQGPCPIAGHRETAVEIPQDHEGFARREARVDPGLQYTYLIPKIGADLFALLVLVLARAPATGLEVNGEEAELASAPGGRNVGSPAFGRIRRPRARTGPGGADRRCPAGGRNPSPDDRGGPPGDPSRGGRDRWRGDKRPRPASATEGRRAAPPPRSPPPGRRRCRHRAPSPAVRSIHSRGPRGAGSLFRSCRSDARGSTRRCEARPHRRPRKGAPPPGPAATRMER